jgi:hypothetical protein
LHSPFADNFVSSAFGLDSEYVTKVIVPTTEAAAMKT